MKMKKIISALVIGATAAGIATADLSLSLPSKLAGYAFQYNADGKGGFKDTKKKNLFDVDGYDGTGSDLDLTAKGNIFTFFTKVSVKSDTLDNTVKGMYIRANVGDFQFTTGHSRSGINNMDFSDPAGGNDKGAVKGTLYKLGSPFGTALTYSNGQTGFGKDSNAYFAHAKYGFGLGDTVKLNLAAAVISPHGTNNSQKVTADNVVGGGGNSGRVDNTQMGWSVNVNPVIEKIVSVEAFAKGYGHKQGEDGHNFFLGGYAKLLCVPILSNAVLGGSVWLDGHDGRTCLEEWNVDLGLAFKLGDRFNLAFNNKFAYKDGFQANTGGTASDAVGLAKRNGDDSKQQCHYLLWDVLSASFKLNDTLTILGSVGQQTGFGKKDMENTAKTFTTVFVYPRLQVFATSKSSVSAGVVATFDGIGTNVRAADGKKEKMALLINVPFVVKVVL